MQPVFLLYKKKLSDVLLALQCLILQVFFSSGALLCGGAAGLYTACQGSRWGGHGGLHRLGTSACLSEQGRDRQGDKEEIAKEGELK